MSRIKYPVWQPKPRWNQSQTDVFPLPPQLTRVSTCPSSPQFFYLSVHVQMSKHQADYQEQSFPLLAFKSSFYGRGGFWINHDTGGLIRVWLLMMGLLNHSCDSFRGPWPLQMCYHQLVQRCNGAKNRILNFYKPSLHVKGRVWSEKHFFSI